MICSLRGLALLGDPQVEEDWWGEVHNHLKNGAIAPPIQGNEDEGDAAKSVTSACTWLARPKAQGLAIRTICTAVVPGLPVGPSKSATDGSPQLPHVQVRGGRRT